MKNHMLTGLLAALTLLILTACGSSSGGVDTPPPAPAKTSATLKVAISGNLGGKAVAGADFTLTLPANVTPATVSNAVAAGVVTATGTFAGSTISPITTYTAATATVPGKMQIIVSSTASPDVTTAGEVATITLKLANGTTPTATNFVLSSVSVIDTLGNPVAGMSASVVEVTLQ